MATVRLTAGIGVLISTIWVGLQSLESTSALLLSADSTLWFRNETQQAAISPVEQRNVSFLELKDWVALKGSFPVVTTPNGLLRDISNLLL